MPISLISGRRVRKGVSGGVTWLGLVVSVLAAVLIAVVLVPLSMPYISVNLYLAIGIVMLCGFAGSVVDSVLGYWEEMGLGNKFSCNFFCSVAGAALGIVLILLI
jgi:uncharacterized membrane protein